MVAKSICFTKCTDLFIYSFLVSACRVFRFAIYRLGIDTLIANILVHHNGSQINLYSP